MVICLATSILLVLILAGIGFVFFSGDYSFQAGSFFRLDVNTKEAISEIDEKFLSVALDTSFMSCSIHNLTEGEWKKLEELSSLLSPAYLRLGGTQADRVFFEPSVSLSSANYSHCMDVAYENRTDFLIITGEDWIKINDFAKKTGLNLIMDLNVLLRSGPRWDSSNAKSLIQFSEEHGFPLDFQLGNEPNSFLHVFNVSISGSQLAKDFDNLKEILNSTKAYSTSKLIGPDVTRPHNVQEPSIKFLEKFLAGTDSLSAVSWHQYYLNGRTARLEDFINPKVFDELPPQIEAVTEVVGQFNKFLPIWISETSSAYGGGAPGLSDRYAASFLWLDKLGTAARSGIKVVIRQSLFKNNYALISPVFTPSSDFWISFFFKNLVGNKVLDVKIKGSEVPHLRFYSHCLSTNSPINGSLIIYGMNLSNKTEVLITTGINFDYPIYSFIFRPENLHNLKSRKVLLNDKPLNYDRKTVYNVLKNPPAVKLPLVIPYHSIGFWIFKENTKSICSKG